MSGKEDRPENYNNVTYELEPENGGTRLTITQDGNNDEKSKEHSEQNWMYILNELKKFLEQQHGQ
jgi:hypothetical protein